MSKRERVKRGAIGAGAAVSAVSAVGATVLVAPPAQGATFSVTNTNDDGAGSLRQAVERFAARHQLEALVSSQGEARRVPGAAALQIYRIVQEALTNIARHAQATRVTLVLTETPTSFELRLLDDGVGIGHSPGREGSIGLFSMSERAREIGAELHLQPATEGGRGTELTLVLLLPEPARPSIDQALPTPFAVPRSGAQAGAQGDAAASDATIARRPSPAALTVPPADESAA